MQTGLLITTNSEIKIVKYAASFRSEENEKKTPLKPVSFEAKLIKIFSWLRIGTANRHSRILYSEHEADCVFDSFCFAVVS